jgi:hypothetical protein
MAKKSRIDILKPFKRGWPKQPSTTCVLNLELQFLTFFVKVVASMSFPVKGRNSLRENTLLQFFPPKREQ